jgi:hypothetical protein
MVPLSGMEIYVELRSRNDWIEDYLPHASGTPEMPDRARHVIPHAAIQRLLEAVFSLPPGRWLENWEMNRKIERLRREQSHSVESYFSADVCKGHIDRHGANIVTALAVRFAEFPSLLGSPAGVLRKGQR